MMRLNNIQMKTTVSRNDLLRKLEANLLKHSEIVQEARNGYIKKAKQALETRLEDLRQGKLASMVFNLAPPADYSHIYKTALEMLRWNMNDYVELAPEEFRQLVQDQWDWTDSFYGATQTYSKKAWDWVNDNVGGALVPPPE